jgi:hypothetical protein
MALLKVKGEIQELLSLSQTALAKKNRIEAMVSITYLLFESFHAPPDVYLFIYSKQHNLRKTKERIQLLKKWKEEVQKSLESSN